MLDYYLPFRMRDLTPLFQGEPYYRPHSERIRYFADDVTYNWRARSTPTRFFVQEMIWKAHLKELEDMQIQNG